MNTTGLALAFAARTRPVEGGHLEFTGSRGQFGHRGRYYTARRAAYILRTGREPVGMVRSSCDHPGCCAPDCMDDEPDRLRDRTAYAAITGQATVTDVCARGHDQARYRKRLPNGKAYCAECARLAKVRRRERLASETSA